MNIQWFPGHMKKTVRMIDETVGLCDAIIYVVDARAAFACINNDLFGLFGNKPVIIAVNKADLIADVDRQKIISSFKSDGYFACAVNGTLKGDVMRLKKTLTDALVPFYQKNGAKGILKAPRVMVAGVPNTGKSTIINSFCGKKSAVTGNKAGVTRGKQWVKMDGFELLDTPGTMPPKFDDQYYARHLAYIGCINDDIIDFEELSIALIGEIEELYPALLETKYGVEGGAPHELFAAICKKRGFLSSGGNIDSERGARAIVDEFRKGKMGKLCLETQKKHG